MAETSIGSRIRGRRGKVLTQRQLAERANVSIDVIRKLEQGVRRTASVGTLQKIARALDVDLSDLVGKSTALMSDDPESGVVAIRRALTPVDDLLNEVVLYDDAATLEEAQRTLDYAWGAYWAGRYELLGGLLPTGVSQRALTVVGGLVSNGRWGVATYMKGCCGRSCGPVLPGSRTIQQRIEALTRVMPLPPSLAGRALPGRD